MHIKMDAKKLSKLQTCVERCWTKLRSLLINLKKNHKITFRLGLLKAASVNNSAFKAQCAQPFPNPFSIPNKSFV